MSVCSPFPSTTSRRFLCPPQVIDIPGKDTDAFPPAAVRDLRVTSVSGDRITLAWTAPGDDLDAGKGEMIDGRMRGHVREKSGEKKKEGDMNYGDTICSATDRKSNRNNICMNISDAFSCLGFLLLALIALQTSFLRSLGVHHAPQ